MHMKYTIASEREEDSNIPNPHTASPSLPVGSILVFYTTYILHINPHIYIPIHRRDSFSVMLEEIMMTLPRDLNLKRNQKEGIGHLG